MKVSSALRSTLLVIAGLWMASAAQASLRERPLSGVSFIETLSDAKKVALRHSGMEVLRIEGRSMLPFFGEGSVVVIKQIASEQLRAGMVVVYRNRFGETVAHRLIARSESGWVAQGYNNTAADSTAVSDENLLGVVYATFHSNGQPGAATPALASLAGSTPVALAAPAR